MCNGQRNPSLGCGGYRHDSRPRGCYLLFRREDAKTRCHELQLLHVSTHALCLDVRWYASQALRHLRSLAFTTLRQSR